MAGADIIFDEDRGGPRHPSNYLSLPVDGLVHQSTKYILPWSQAGAHEAPGTRVIIPSSYIEKIFKEATVKVTEELKNFTWLTRCLSIKFLSPAVEVLIVEKLFTKPDPGWRRSRVQRHRQLLRRRGSGDREEQGRRLPSNQRGVVRMVGGLEQQPGG